MSRDNSRQRNAVRRAREARARRDQARKVREDQVEAALASLFAALAAVERLRALARRKADAALADGERAIAEPYAAACTAVRTLRELLGSNSAVAELCELRVEDVRDMLAAARAQQPVRADKATSAVRTDDGSSGVFAGEGDDAGRQSAGVQLRSGPENQGSCGLE
jgi:Tfp pilus assembly protein PilX